MMEGSLWWQAEAAVLADNGQGAGGGGVGELVEKDD